MKEALDAGYGALRALEQPDLKPDPVDVLGFDLGHGDTSITRIHVLGGDANKLEILKGSKTVPTAVARTSNGIVLIGRQAYSKDARDLVHQFKSSHVNEISVSEPVGLFVRTALDKVRENNNTIPFDRTTLVVFGCPSAWNDEERLAYGNILAQAAQRLQVMLVRESRAAFITMKETRQLSLNQLRESILIVDLGSSTTDFTFSRDLEPEELPIGRQWPLGASAIERQLVEMALQSSPAKEAIRAWWKAHPSEYHRTVWEFRQRKEEFFSDEDSCRRGLPLEARVTYHVSDDKKVRLETELTADTFMQAIDTPAELGPRPISWRGRLREDLKNASQEIVRLTGANPRYVIITGGAARMDFVLELAKEVFPAPVSIMRAPEPEHAISIGLAHAGSIHFRTRSFRQEIEHLIESTAVEDIITKRMPEFAQTIADAVAENFTLHYVIPCFLEWRRSDRGTLRGVIENVSAMLKQWLKSDAGQAALLAAMKNWYVGVESDLHEVTSEICVKYKIDADALDIPRNPFSPNEAGRLTNAGDLIFGSARPIMSAILGVISFVIGSILFGAGTAVLMPTGPLAPLLAGIFLWILGEAGKEVVIGKAMDSEIPGWVRRAIPESWVKNNFERKAFETDAQVRETIRISIVGGFPLKEPGREGREKQAEANRERIMRGVTDGVEAALKARAEEAAVLIR